MFVATTSNATTTTTTAGKYANKQWQQLNLQITLAKQQWTSWQTFSEIKHNSYFQNSNNINYLFIYEFLLQLYQTLLVIVQFSIAPSWVLTSNAYPAMMVVFHKYLFWKFSQHAPELQGKHFNEFQRYFIYFC